MIRMPVVHPARAPNTAHPNSSIIPSYRQPYRYHEQQQGASYQDESFSLAAAASASSLSSTAMASSA